MKRAQGANATLLGKTQAAFASIPSGPFLALPFVSGPLTHQQTLVDDDILGRGREPQDPSLGDITDEDSFVVPVDVNNFGQWLTWFLGAPVTTGPVNGLYTHTWDTAAAAPLAAVLQVGFSDVGRYYTHVGPTPNTLTIPFGGQAGNKNATVAYVGKYALPRPGSLAAAAGKISFTAQPANNSTLTLNGTTWTFVTGSPTAGQTQIGADLPATLRQLSADLNASSDTQVKKCRYKAVLDAADPDVNSLAIAYKTEGTGGNTWTLVAGAGTNGTASGATLAGGAASTSRAVKRFQSVHTVVQLGGADVSNLLQGELTLSNNLDKVPGLKGGTLQGVDPGKLLITGKLTGRFSDDATIDELAEGNLPASMTFGYSMPSGESLTFSLGRVIFPQPKYTVRGPNGVEASFDAKASATGLSQAMTVTLVNGISQYQ